MSVFCPGRLSPAGSLSLSIFSLLTLLAARASAQLAPPVVEPPPGTAPAPLPAPSPSLSASLDEGMIARSADGAFSFRIGLQSQLRFELSSHPDRTRDAGFILRMARPQLRGHVLVPWVRFFVQPELGTATPRLLDYELELRPHDAAGLRFGQFLTPFSRSFLTPVPKLQFPDFSVANEAFRADRDTGAELFGTPLRGYVNYHLGVFNGNGINKGNNDDKEFLLVGRVAVNPLGRLDYDETRALAKDRRPRLALGFNGYLGESAHNTQITEPGGVVKVRYDGTDRNRTLGADLAFSWERLSLLVEAYTRASTAFDGATRNALGGFVQAAVMVIDRKAEVGGRLSLVDPNTSASDDRLRVIEGLVTYYAHGNQLKVHARYASARNELASGVAAPGTTIHTLALQTQLFF